MTQTRVEPKGIISPTTYSQAIVTTGAKHIYVSGQLAIDEQGNVVGRGDIKTQTRQVFQNLSLVLEKAGAQLSDIVKLNTYLTNIDDLPLFSNERKEILGTHRPASTLVEVSRLAYEGCSVEVEAIAIID